MFDGAVVDLSDFTSVDEIVGVAHNGGGITWSVKPHKHVERWHTFSAPAPAKAAGGEPATNCLLKALSDVGVPRHVISVAAATLQCDIGVPRVLSYSAVGRCLLGYMAHTVDVDAGSFVAHKMSCHRPCYSRRRELPTQWENERRRQCVAPSAASR